MPWGSGSQSPPRMSVTRTPEGQAVVTEGGKPVLRYNYQTVEPGALLSQIAEPNLKYARARSDYVHPLYGFDGEELTKDFPIDHPHHRGIYWAWPETMYGQEMGDLHALQRVFARPTGRIRTRAGNTYAQIVAESAWMWEDREAIVREQAAIRVSRAAGNTRYVDLTFRIEATKEGVSLARRGTNAYGGLNMRMNSVRDQKITFHTDPPGAKRAAWGEMHGIFGEGRTPTSVVVLQHPQNPHYPGDWVQFPELNWFQPTFPAANTRYALSLGKPLVLRYRIWVRQGPPVTEDEARLVWTRFAGREAAGGK